MSTAANHRTRSHRTYYIRHSAMSGHARATQITTQRRKPAGGFFGRLFRGRKREAHNVTDT